MAGSARCVPRLREGRLFETAALRLPQSLPSRQQRVKKLFFPRNVIPGRPPRVRAGARPEDRLRAEPGTQEHLNFQYVRRPVFMGSGLAGSARAPE